MAAYNSNDIVDIILIGKVEHPNAMQIRRILLRERRRIRKSNRKQINAEDDVNDSHLLAVLAMINLNPHISTKEREVQCNLEIPYVTV